MATSSHSKGFTFGVEIEIYLKPKVETVSSLLKERKWTTGDELTPDERRDNRAAILATIAAILIEAGLDAVTTVKNAKDEYADWLVKFDASLPHAGGYWGVELVSPIMYATEWVWFRELKAIFPALDEAFDFQSNAACSTHIHMKPVGGWDPGAANVRSLLKAAAVFDDAITRIMPATRKQTPWARPNFREIAGDPKEAHLNPFQLSTAEKGLVTFFNNMKTSKKAWEHLFKHFDNKVKKRENIDRFADTRNVSMNFVPINGSCQTVEFRRPPGVGTATEAVRWVAFALGFVSAALDPESSLVKQWSPQKNDATVTDLQKHIGSGLMRLASLTGKDSWKTVVRSKSFEEDTSKPYPLSRYSPAVIAAKLLKSQKPSSLEEKVSTSRENSRANSPASVSTASSSRDSSPSRPPKTPMKSGSTTGTVPSSPTAGTGPTKPTGSGSVSVTPAGSPAGKTKHHATGTGTTITGAPKPPGPGSGVNPTPSGSPARKKKQLPPAGTGMASTGTGTTQAPSATLPVGSHKKSKPAGA